MDIETWIYLLKKENVLFYDSTKGEAPRVIDGDLDIKAYDVSNHELKEELDEVFESLGEKLTLDDGSENMSQEELIETLAEHNNAQSRTFNVGSNFGHTAASITLSDSPYQPSDVVVTSEGETQANIVVPNSTMWSVEHDVVRPLTTDEVSQLDVEDPRARDSEPTPAIGDGELSQEEIDLIDNRMNQQRLNT